MESRKFSPDNVPHWRRNFIIGLAGAAAIAGAVVGGTSMNHPSSHNKHPISTVKNGGVTHTVPEAQEQNQARENSGETLPYHKNITATIFWVGEPADEDNHHITNRSSTWVQHWQKEFGGVDDPQNRCANYLPCGFIPKENPFYAALPFNDLKPDSSPKPVSILKKIPWYEGPAPEGQSVVKNHWIEVIHNGITVYVQWEDAGPFGEDDEAYVFGYEQPKSRTNNHAGIDLSPAAADYLHLDGEGSVNWRFVDANQVPDGPWKRIVTHSGPHWP